jgi:hypothetical protein
MGRRGKNSFKRSDALRVIALARKAGIEPAVFEIVTPDGVTYRVSGSNIAPAADEDSRAVKAWAEEVEKLRASKRGK